ncbi:hypothetical protein LTR84_008219 [Exophiala bonariae]|uniref:Uncharacterized protein n=1 Tax=Exophiala bonariae TaxID=1690606 RepID=A0AAV9N0T6_9EURO|nr:hypothetical protein LTR84_008219 [Exophiala bonariae]
MAARTYDNVNLQFPSNEDVRDSGIYTIPAFQNDFSHPEKAHRISLIRPNVDDNHVGDDDMQAVAAKDHVQSILTPTVIICVPIVLLAGALLALVLIFRVNPKPVSQPASDRKSESNQPAARLVFVASFLSTVAPLLGSYIMALIALPVSRDLEVASRNSEYLKLPTPYQMSLLIGILVAATEQLRTYFGYLLHRTERAGIPRVLHRSAWMMTLTIALAGAVSISDAVLHYMTSTIEFDQVFVRAVPDRQFGRGVSEFCLDFDREKVGLPCSVEFDFVDPNKNFEQTEASRLVHNTSQTSTIRFANLHDQPGSDIAYLTPSDQAIATGTDFHATTVGISTMCELVPASSCSMASWGPTDVYTNFTCSDMFHGTIGMPPNVSDVSSVRIPDAYRSFLMYKPAQNIMYTFFNDSSMKTVYNTVGYNDSGLFDLNIFPLNDSQLVNPFYLALAGRTEYSSFESDSEMLITNDTKRDQYNSIVDFIVNCAVTSYDVSYTWFNQSLYNISAIPTTNGSVLEIFHGSQLYSTVSGGSFDLQDFVDQSSMSGSTKESFLGKFGSLYSSKVLAKIGGYSTNRMALQQQHREHMLLSKVPVVPLSLLIAWSFAYPILGLVLALQAYWAAQHNIKEIVAKLSLRGLSQAAFEDQTEAGSPARSVRLSRENVVQLSKQDTRRVLVDGNATRGFEFRVVV